MLKPIVSYHKFDGILNVSAMEKILDEQIASGASVCKIVLTAKQIEDNLPSPKLRFFASTKAKLVCFCMGEHGKTSRLLSPVFGAFFTFASLERRQRNRRWTDEYKRNEDCLQTIGDKAIMTISGKTRVCGVIGDPIEHSLSPIMHNAAFEALKLGLRFFGVQS